MGTNNLRPVEKIILSKLDSNSRIAYSELGGKLGKSQQQVSYVVSSLTKRGIIQKFYSLIDYSKLNVLNFRVYFRVNYINQEKLDELIEHFVENPYTSWVATCGGRYDLICGFLTLNPSQFNKTLKEIMIKFPNQLQNYEVLTTIVLRSFGRKYLVKDYITKELFVGGDRLPEKVDDNDMKILSELSEDARKSSVEIANKLSLTPKTVIQRIKNLQKNEVIIGFKQLLNARKMNHISSLLLVKYHNVSSEMEDELIKYLKVHPNIISVVKTLGEWDVEIEIETIDSVERRKIEMGIRQRFASLIQQTENIPLYLSYKKNYFPTFLETIKENF
ncbi:winged helix-turn-helix transcriptional regulator [Candidatus Woesearchaeota archaeon]|nr:winged helix-turn-helix transcriptional regulator [Candidatus Woesearchaeota archaeon]